MTTTTTTTTRLTPTYRLSTTMSLSTLVWHDSVANPSFLLPLPRFGHHRKRRHQHHQRIFHDIHDWFQSQEWRGFRKRRMPEGRPFRGFLRHGIQPQWLLSPSTRSATIYSLSNPWVFLCSSPPKGLLMTEIKQLLKMNEPYILNLLIPSPNLKWDNLFMFYTTSYISASISFYSNVPLAAISL